MAIWEAIEKILILFWNRLYYFLSGHFEEEVNPDWVLPEE